MNWDAIGAIGEILGAVGVIATLGYLAAQIRASTRQSRVSMVQAIGEAFNGTHHAMMVNPQISEVLAKRLSGAELSPAEELQWEAFANRIFNIYTSVQRAYDGGQVDRNYYEMGCQDVARVSVQYGLNESLRKILQNFPNESKLEIFASLYVDSKTPDDDL